mmetsp:Transcript_100142/g.188643  ORF Transcript_100142/g.188643 Transcript_100142/m.188643 type:complete len:236 (+) Transcript_100142:642-1349(+)
MQKKPQPASCRLGARCFLLGARCRWQLQGRRLLCRRLRGLLCTPLSGRISQCRHLGKTSVLPVRSRSVSSPLLGPLPCSIGGSHLRRHPQSRPAAQCLGRHRLESGVCHLPRSRRKNTEVWQQPKNQCRLYESQLLCRPGGKTYPPSSRSTRRGAIELKAGPPSRVQKICARKRSKSASVPSHLRVRLPSVGTRIQRPSVRTTSVLKQGKFACVQRRLRVRIQDSARTENLQDHP